MKNIPLYCFLLILLSCAEPTNIIRSDFDFLIGKWEMYNAHKETETTMTWTNEGNRFSAIVKTKSDVYSRYNFTTEYTIYKKNNKWYWYNDHTQQTNKPSYHYELRKLTSEDAAVNLKPGQFLFTGSVKGQKKDSFQLYWDNKRLLVKYNMFTSGYLFEKKS